MQANAVDTLAKRVQSILDEKKWGQRELSAKAKVSPAHVGLLVRGNVKRPAHTTLEKIARAGGVELEWLSSGNGPRELAPGRAVFPEADERYHAMPAVRAMARADGYPEEFVAKFEAQLDLDEQPSADSLWSLLKIAWESHQRAEARKGKALPPKTPDRGVDPFADIDD